MSGILEQCARWQQVGHPSDLPSIFQEVRSGGGGSQGGGIGALISRFEHAGLGQQMQSWIGNGQNAPISPDQVGQVFLAEEIQGWAQQAATTPGKMKQVLAEALSHVVDATPNGRGILRARSVVGLGRRLHDYGWRLRLDHDRRSRRRVIDLACCQ